MIVYQRTTLFRSCEFRGGEFFYEINMGIRNNTPDLILELRSGVYYIREYII